MARRMGGSDAQADADADAGPRACSVGTIDASTPALTVRWIATAPVANHTPVVIGTITQPACTADS